MTSLSILNASLARYDLYFEDLYNLDKLPVIDEHFLKFCKYSNKDLHDKLKKYRENPPQNPVDESEFILELGTIAEKFIIDLFGLQGEFLQIGKEHKDLENLYKCQRLFVQRRAIKKYKTLYDILNIEETITFLSNQEIEFEKPYIILNELDFANKVIFWMANEAEYAKELDEAMQYAAYQYFSQMDKDSTLFRVINKTDYQNLVQYQKFDVSDNISAIGFGEEHISYREGFGLTDQGVDRKEALHHANYCIFCHNRSKDSCSKGSKDKEGNLAQNPLGTSLGGCPLNEKISEMNKSKSEGHFLGSLAIAMIDNPMIPATGHRICNDCMKSCIYQKQDPVNIPAIESQVLKDILSLPWGFEIYSLLTRWNPLNIRTAYSKKLTNKKVLVVGMGPAGFTLAHYLLHSGHTVCGIDGLKIEPLPKELTQNFRPIYDIEEELYEELDKRISWGFGGVAEYGITVRFNKNLLKVIRLVLERRENFQLYSNIRFGSNITLKQAWDLGFDHIALAIGAGKPTIVDIKNNLSKGIRTASDFLMSLQLSGAARNESIANLTVRLPILVIGGGLTAIDTCTEALAYYAVQVEKFLFRYEYLTSLYDKEYVESMWSNEDAEIAHEFLRHAGELRDEKERAARQNRPPNLVPILNSYGGAKIIYRKNLNSSPAYKLNHEEVSHALSEGIQFIENTTPIEALLDEYQTIKGLRVKSDNKEEVLRVRSLFMAAGTQPNTVLMREEGGERFSLNGKYFEFLDVNSNNRHSDEINKLFFSQKASQFFIGNSKNNPLNYVSIFGDLHPVYSGNVVKAMASGKYGSTQIEAVLETLQPSNDLNSKEFFNKLDDKFIATVKEINRLTSNIIEVVVHAPIMAENFQPGQFYRFQNFETYSSRVTLNEQETLLSMEGIASTGASVDLEKGLVSMILLEMGGSSNLCAHLKLGEEVVLMGPTGTPTEIDKNTTVMLAGGGLGNAVLFSIGKALRNAGCFVLYFAGYKKLEDRYKVSEIEDAADIVVWCCDEGELSVNREGDLSYHDNIVNAMKHYSQRRHSIMADVSKIIAIGSDRMMQAVHMARKNQLKEYLNPNHEAVGSINSPMQCMMKEICAQCLQKHIDPKTGEEYFVYSCFNQDQNLDYVDFANLNARLGQNSLQEKITSLWIKECLKHVEYN